MKLKRCCWYKQAFVYFGVLLLVAGCAPPGAKVRMPIVLQVKKHEADLFAWRPPFSVNVVA